MKVSRRELVALALSGGAVAATAVAQETPEDQFKRNADALEKFELKQDIEPAFAFKA
jgi:hypothetical protein